jgi:choline dehydrogenase-like flavoprotein
VAARFQIQSKEVEEGNMRIAVVGAGVVGGYFGGHLAHAGEDVVFVERGATLKAIREHGLQVDGVDSNFVVRPAQATDDPTSVGPVDVVLLAVKGWQVQGAIKTLHPLMGPQTFAVPLMDGSWKPRLERSCGWREKWVSRSHATSSCTPVFFHRNEKRGERSSSRLRKKRLQEPHDDFHLTVVIPGGTDERDR